MNKLQLTIVGLSILFFLALFFGASTKPANYAAIEKKRALTAESTDISSLLIGAKPNLTKQEATFIASIEQQISNAQTDSVRTVGYKNIASKWYEYKRADISGFYAEEVAKLEKTEQSWSIAGTTYMLGARQSNEDKIKRFCSSRAVIAFENAISLNSSSVSHRLNLATCYAENPPKENPMKGVLMLLDLNKENPESVPVLVTLGRFGIQTGQFDKAIERLNKAIRLDGNNRQAHCLLAEALNGLGEKEAASIAEQKCAILQQQ